VERSPQKLKHFCKLIGLRIRGCTLNYSSNVNEKNNTFARKNVTQNSQPEFNLIETTIQGHPRSCI